MKGLFALVVLTLAAGTALGGKGRHRVRPNQQVWEQIVGNMERKKQGAHPSPLPAVPVAAVAAVHPTPNAEPPKNQNSTMEPEEPMLKGLKKSRRAPRPVMYNGRHAVGRQAKLIQFRGKPKKALSAVSESRSAQGMAQSIRAQIIEMKRRRKEKAAAAAAKAEKKGTGGADGRSWDKVWKPPTESEPQKKQQRRVSLKDIEDAEERKAQHKEPQDPEDPFGALNVDFKAAQASEQKKQEANAKAEKSEPAVAAQDATQAVEADLKAKEKAAVAGAEGETLTKHWAFDVDQDPMGGVAAMEKDATSMLTAADKDSQDEATAVGSKARKARQAINDIAAKTEAAHQDDASGLAASLAPEKEAPPPPQKEETLEDAVKKANEAEQRERVANAMVGVGKIWAKKTHDMALNTEISSDAKKAAEDTRERVEKVIEIEGEKAADQLGDLDQEWKQRFPDSSGQLSTVYRHLGN